MEDWKRVENFWFKYTLSVVAASTAEVATYPLDMVKTRLQIQGEASTWKAGMPYKGMLRTAYGIVHEEGLFRLWQGITPAIYRHIVYSGSRMTLYEFLRENILQKNSDGTIDIWKAILGGVFAGGFSQFLANPTDLVKVQIQMEGRRRLEGLEPRVRNTRHAFSKVFSEGGVRGLWKGWAPNVQRAALVNLGDLTTYDTSKHLILKHTNLLDNALTHCLASICSGLVAATLGTPADVIKTRVMNQPTDNTGRGLLYKSSVDCLMKATKEEGFFSLYKGFVPIWMRMAPWSLTFWLTYEQLRVFTGVSSF